MYALKRTVLELKKVFCFISKTLFFILEIIRYFQIFECHDVIKYLSMKHETFYWITWEVNIFWWCNLAGLCNITKENFLSKNSMKTVTWKLAPGPFQFSKNPLKRNMRRWWFGQILIFLRIYQQTVFFLSYLKNISHFMLGHLMTSWNLNI